MASVKKSVRFEVFKRDGFKCQYCGQSAPDVVLHCDHIHPASKGGGDDVMNLVTSCADCNLGKGVRELDDNSVIAKQRAQLEELNEKREQLEMMLAWREGVRDLKGAELESFCAAYEQRCPGWVLNEKGITTARKLLARHGLAACLEALDELADTKVVVGDDGRATRESTAHIIDKIGGTIFLKSQPEDVRQLYYVRGILRNRLRYVNERRCMALLRELSGAGATTAQLKEMARSCSSWTSFCQMAEDAFGIEE